MLGAKEDNPAIRLSLANLLNTADLRPSGVSPSSVLIVREFGDPLPGRIMPSRFSTRIDLSWELAVRTSLAQIYRQAARPVQGYIPGNARAVLFADESEMLACLALDLSRRTAVDRWWWQLILRSLPSATAGTAVTLLYCKAGLVPAIMQQLFVWGLAAEVLETVAPDQAIKILSAVAKVFGALEVWKILSEASLPPPVFSEDRNGALQHQVVSDATAARDDIREIGSNAAAQAPWDGWLSADTVAVGMAREKACLLGIGLSLYWRPGEVKTSGFLNALRIWWQSRPASIEPRPSVVNDEPYRRQSRVSNNEIYSGSALKSRIPTPDDSDSAVEQTDTENVISADSAAQSLPKFKWINRRNPAAPGSAKDKLSARKQSEPVRSASRRVARRNELSESALDVEEGVATRLSGILYLINLMHRLDLPACFEKDWGLGGQIGSWGLLEILARGFLYPTHDIYMADPIWQVLARLDGRLEESLPGENFCGSDRFYLPLDWVDQVRSRRSWIWFWLANRTHVLLWSDQGFLLAEVPRTIDSASIQMRKVRRAYIRCAPVTAVLRHTPPQLPTDLFNAPLTEGLHPHIKRWLVRVLPYLQLRLKLALDPMSSNPEDFVKILLACSGRLFVTSSHVDLVMDIDDISFPVRRAGLDVNPGWMPDFGRVIQFHYGKRG